MTGTHLAPRLFAAAAAVTLVLWAGSAFSQEADATAATETPPQADALGEAQALRQEGNNLGAASQKRIDAISEETESLFTRYSNTVRQIESIRVYNRQMQELVDAQNVELASLGDQLDRVEEVGRSVTPLMLRMIDAIAKFVELDVPFLIEERTERVAELRQLMARADVNNAEKYRAIMEAYQIENDFGRTIEAYRGTIDSGGREITVDFLRFGRIALVYQSLDEEQAGVWDMQAKNWKPLDSSFRSPIREGLRIARKQTAPDMIKLPLPAPSGGAS
jgi:hypothetical protein